MTVSHFGFYNVPPFYLIPPSPNYFLTLFCCYCCCLSTVFQTASHPCFRKILPKHIPWLCRVFVWVAFILLLSMMLSNFLSYSQQRSISFPSALIVNFFNLPWRLKRRKNCYYFFCLLLFKTISHIKNPLDIFQAWQSAVHYAFLALNPEFVKKNPQNIHPCKICDAQCPKMCTYLNLHSVLNPCCIPVKIPPKSSSKYFTWYRIHM